MSVAASAVLLATLLVPVASTAADRVRAPAAPAPPAATPSIPATPAPVAQAPTPAQQAPTAAAGATPTQLRWSEPEIHFAKARCQALLYNTNAVYTALPPIREGVCGAPAPIALKSLGAKPAVTFEPPITVTCELAAELSVWIDREVQPAARELLKGAVVRMPTMSSYSCRNAYNRKSTHLSEHGKANAVDIGGFETEHGQLVTVLADWGPTAREIAEIAASAAKSAPSPSLPSPAPEAPAASMPSLAPPAVPAWPPAITVKPSLGFQPSKLGGKVTGPEIDPGQKSAFLRRIHDAACRMFGTTLGPEANADHRNHFHLDMAERKFKKICD